MLLHVNGEVVNNAGICAFDRNIAQAVVCPDDDGKLNSSSLLSVVPKFWAIFTPLAVSSVSMATLSSRSECRMMKTAFSSAVRLL